MGTTDFWHDAPGIKSLPSAVAFIVFVGLVSLTVYQTYPDIIRYVSQFDAQAVADLLKQVRGSIWAPFAVVLVYVGAGMIFFPATVISLGVAAAFGPWLGILYGMIGALVSASLTFWIGQTSRGQWLYKLIPPRILKRFEHKLKRGGLSAVAILRMIIFAPFSLFNLVMGVSKVTFQDFFIGSAIGMLPGFIARAFVGGSLMSLLINPSAKDIGYLAGGILLWAGLVIAARLLSKKFNS